MTAASPPGIPAPLRRTAFGALVAAILLAGAAAARADVVHLKNGGSIVCESIEERGADLLLRQKTGVITVPRADVLRIERTAPPAAGGAAPAVATPGGTAPAAPAAPGGPAAATPTIGRPGADLAADERRVEFLRRRIAETSAAGSGAATLGLDRREIVARLTVLGEAALSRRAWEEARRRTEEALTYEPANARARRALGVALIGLEQPARARTVLEQALLDKPDDADALLILATAFEKLDRDPEAIAALKKSNALRPDAAVRARIEDLERHQGVDGGFRRAAAAHFSLAYDGAATAPDVGKEILAYLEEQFPRVAMKFDYTPREPIAVVVYTDREFRQATLAHAGVAGLFDGRVRIPAGGLHRLDEGSRAVLRHELAHAFVAGKSAGGAPRWLHEGLAQIVEGRPVDPGAERELAQEWNRSPRNPRWGTEFTYASSLSFVTWLIGREGLPAMNDVLAAMGRGDGVDRAFETVTRATLPELRAAWGEDLARRFQR